MELLRLFVELSEFVRAQKAKSSKESSPTPDHSLRGKKPAGKVRDRAVFYGHGWQSVSLGLTS